MAPHSSTLAWKIPWMEKPGGLQSMGLLRVGHDWATSLSLFTFHFHALEKEMATHSSVLAWRIPGTGESGGLPSMESHTVGHDWSDLAAAAAAGIIVYVCKRLSMYVYMYFFLACCQGYNKINPNKVFIAVLSTEQSLLISTSIISSWLDWRAQCASFLFSYY